MKEQISLTKKKSLRWTKYLKKGKETPIRDLGIEIKQLAMKFEVAIKIIRNMIGEQKPHARGNTNEMIEKMIAERNPHARRNTNYT